MDAHELVDGDHDIEDLLLGDVAVAVQVVQGERPLQLLVRCPPQQGGQGDQHVLDEGEKEENEYQKPN